MKWHVTLQLLWLEFYNQFYSYLRLTRFFECKESFTTGPTEFWTDQEEKLYKSWKYLFHLAPGNIDYLSQSIFSIEIHPHIKFLAISHHKSITVVPILLSLLASVRQMGRGGDWGLICTVQVNQWIKIKISIGKLLVMKMCCLKLFLEKLNQTSSKVLLAHL